MRVGISNLAWDVSQDSIYASILAEHDVTSVDLCPLKYAGADIVKVRDFWLSHGISINGFQALFYGHDLNVTRDPLEVMDHLGNIAMLAQAMGVSKLTFGAPGVRSGCTLENSVEHFRLFGDVVQKFGCTLCLEPVAGQEFCGNSQDTFKFVECVSRDALKMQLDIGSMLQNGEYDLDWCTNSSLIGHLHDSRPGLAPTNSVETYEHRLLNDCIRSRFGDRIITVEMLPAQTHEIVSSLLISKRNFE